MPQAPGMGHYDSGTNAFKQFQRSLGHQSRLLTKLLAQRNPFQQFP